MNIIFYLVLCCSICLTLIIRRTWWLGLLIDRLSVKSANRTLTILEFANVFMHVLTLAPDHCGIGSVWTSVPKTIMVKSHVFARVLRPDKGTFSFSNIIPEISLELSQILNLNCTVTVQ